MHRIFRHDRVARAAVALLLATLAVRALMPLGYMPGNLLEGRIAELCPVASAATYALFSQDGSHKHHAHHGDATDSSGYSMDSVCPIGTSLLADVLPAFDVQIALDTQPDKFHRILVTRSHVARPELHYPARAPPLS